MTKPKADDGKPNDLYLNGEQPEFLGCFGTPIAWDQPSESAKSLGSSRKLGKKHVESKLRKLRKVSKGTDVSNSKELIKRSYYE